MDSEKSNSKTFTFKWAPLDSGIREDRSGFRWFGSPYFKYPNDSKVVFQIWTHRDAEDTEYVEILKMGSLNPNRADITIKFLGIQKDLKVLDWDGYTKFVTFDDAFYEDGDEIICTIRPHEYNDFKLTDESILSTSKQPHLMNDFLFSQELSDVIIKVKNEEFPAHKIVLASHSPVFRRMFNTDMKESKDNCISFEKLDPDVIKEMIKFMYTGNIESETDIDVLFTLLSYAKMYQIEKLQTYCEYQLIHILDNNNVIKMAVCVDNHEVPNLETRIMDYLIFHKTKISATEAINQVQNSKILRKFFIKESKMIKN